MGNKVRSRMRQADISRLIGVSQATVSLALNGSDKISPELRARIQELATETGYLPAPESSSEPQFITLLVNENLSESYLPLDLLRGIETGLRRTDWRLQLLEIPDAIKDSQEDLLLFLRRFAGQAVLFGHSNAIPQAVIELVDRQAIPHIWINALMPSDCVVPDDRGAARFAVSRLHQLGHRRIGYLRLIHCTHHSGAERFNGYSMAMTEFFGGVDESLVLSLETDVDCRLRILLDWLGDRRERPGAILCYGNNEAMVLHTAALRLGIRVPEELSIIAINERLLTQLGFEMTTLQVPFFEIGRRAVELLIRKLEEPGIVFMPEVIPMIFHPGSSIAPPEESRKNREPAAVELAPCGR